MQVYEIRLLKDDLATQTVIEQQYLNDHAAIRSAQRMAQAKQFEVWRGLDCIYGARAQAHRTPWSPRPAT